MPKCIVFDTETTGAKQPMKIVEAAWREFKIDCDPSEIMEEFHSMYDPRMPIEIGAMAAHGIIPDDLRDAPPSESFALPADVEYVIGHKVDFDMGAIGLEADTKIKRICTLAISRKYFPTLDSHTQSAMLYHFLVPQVARDAVKNAHRASDDVRNCAWLTELLIEHAYNNDIAEIRTYEDLWMESERCRIPDTMSFGKHVGMRIEDLPFSYKQWLLSTADIDPYLKKAVRMSF